MVRSLIKHSAFFSTWALLLEMAGDCVRALTDWEELWVTAGICYMLLSVYTQPPDLCPGGNREACLIVYRLNYIYVADIHSMTLILRSVSRRPSYSVRHGAVYMLLLLTIKQDDLCLSFTYFENLSSGLRTSWAVCSRGPKEVQCPM